MQQFISLSSNTWIFGGCVRAESITLTGLQVHAVVLKGEVECDTMLLI